MNVICSGTPSKGILSTEECVQCALDRENTCGYDYALLKSMFYGSDRSGVHVTDLTGCLRKSWLDKNKPKPQWVHERLVLFIGTAMHGFLEEGDEYIDAELPLEALGVRGTADVVYKADGRVIDYKTTRWLNPTKLPYGSHTLQVNVYAYLLEAMGREVSDLYIQYIDMSGPTKCRRCKLPVRPNDGGVLLCPKCEAQPRNAHLGAYLVPIAKMDAVELTNFVHDRTELINMADESEIPPDAEPGFLCAYCPHWEHGDCPEGEQEVG
jgi:CRISPR/Cas system-associated exonuclease Cas4 (RecB family)